MERIFRDIEAKTEIEMMKGLKESVDREMEMLWVRLDNEE